MIIAVVGFFLAMHKELKEINKAFFGELLGYHCCMEMVFPFFLTVDTG
jgi:hypothetical protein